MSSSVAGVDGALSSFAAIVGPRHVLTADGDTAAYLTEWRKLFTGRALAVLRPGSTDEVAAILRVCAERIIPVVPQGGNTGLVGGQTPDDSGRAVVLSLGRLDRVRDVDPLGDTMVVEAGVTLQRVQEAAEAVDRLFPLSLASQGTCTVGGNIATNAGGTAVLHYGNMRELVLGLEVVLADGRVWNGLGRLRKDNTGYDLRNLFIGSEGTLGVVTAAVLKLFPKPGRILTALVAIPSPEAALDLLARAKGRAGGVATTFELLPRFAMDLVTAHMPNTRDPFAAPYPWYVLMELSGGSDADLQGPAERMLADAMGAGLVLDAVIAASSDQRDALWRLREMLPHAQNRAGASMKHDISLPVALVPRFVAETLPELERLVPGCRPLPYGHAGDGNLHFNITQPEGMDAGLFMARWPAVSAMVYDRVLALGGSVSAEHGIGQMKRDLLAATKDPVALDLMRRFKVALDPQGILNPGKVI